MSSTTTRRSSGRTSRRRSVASSTAAAASQSFEALAREPDPAAAVAAEIDALDEECVLVLDDYHVIENDECHESVMRFVELAPPVVQVAIASRSDPPFPVARLRAIGDLVELRATDLQFAPDESEELLNDILALHLDPAAVETLHERTEGWPAGLYLAYLSMQAAPDRQAFVDTFGASNRHVIDYLTEQVLIALDPDLLRFMLATSIVDAVCGGLADAITGESGSRPPARRAGAGERLHHAPRRAARVVSLPPPPGRAALDRARSPPARHEAATSTSGPPRGTRSMRSPIARSGTRSPRATWTSPPR